MLEEPDGGGVGAAHERYTPKRTIREPDRTQRPERPGTALAAGRRSSPGAYRRAARAAARVAASAETKIAVGIIDTAGIELRNAGHA